MHLKQVLLGFVQLLVLLSMVNRYAESADTDCWSSRASDDEKKASKFTLLRENLLDVNNLH